MCKSKRNGFGCNTKDASNGFTADALKWLQKRRKTTELSKQIGRSNNQFANNVYPGTAEQGGPEGACSLPFSVNNKKIPDKIQPAGVE
jgi:hypothetical protein